MAGLIVYAVFAGGVVAWRYFVISNAVEDALQREFPHRVERRVEGFTPPGDIFERMPRVRKLIIETAANSAVSVATSEVEEEKEGDLLTAQVRQEYPVIEYRDERWLTIPITVKRSLDLRTVQR